MAGLLMAGIDPNIDTVWEGIWWAWVTVSTVGYGDTVPESAAGKIFGAVVILFGVGFFSLLTASFSAYFVSRGEVEIEEEEEEEISQLILIDHVAVIQQPPDQRGFPVVHRPAGEETQQILGLVTPQVLRDVGPDQLFVRNEV